MTTNTDDDNIEIIGGDAAGGRGRCRRQVADRPGRAAGEGDADRHHDQAAARGGARRAARRRQPQPAARDPPAPAFASSRTGWRRNCARSSSGSTLPFTEDSVPSDAELRIAQAQLVGWLEGLFHGIQTALFAQQMAARQQLEQMRQVRCRPASARLDNAAAGVSGTGQYL